MSAIVLEERPAPALAIGEAAGRIVLAGFADGAARAIAAAWRERAGDGEPHELRSIPSSEMVWRELPRLAREARVLCFGPAAAGRELAGRLAELAAAGGLAAELIVLGAGEDSAPFAALVEADRLFYLAARPPAPAEIAQLLAAASQASLPAATEPADDEPPAEVLRAVLEIERCRGLEETLAAVEQAAAKLIPCRRAACRWVDPDTLTLWRPGNLQDEEARDSAVCGLVGFVARTGRSAAAARIGDDPRYDPETDNGGRSPHEPFLAVALPAGPAARRPRAAEAVLALARGDREEPFGLAERERLEALAREAGPILRRRRLAFEQARRESREALFRRQALDHRELGNRARQEPLRLQPAWIGAAYRAVLIGFAVLLLAILFAGAAEPAVGPAVVTDWLRRLER